MADCTDGAKSWSQIDQELHAAGWPGTPNHDQAEIDAYVSAAHCTPCVIGFNDKGRTCGGASAGGTTAPGGSVMDWIKAHPIETGLGALVGVLVVMRR